MAMDRARAGLLSAVAFLCIFSVGPALAGGFDFFDQGSKASGMAGAFVAQADDPSAIFYNIGGLALADEKKGAVGLTVFTLNESLYQGLPPGIGTGTAAQQDESMAFQPHIYLALPLSDRLKLGVGINSPFFFETDWADPDQFAGRGLTTRAKLITYDFNPSLSFAVSRKIGIGFGLVYRTSELSQTRQFFLDDPFTGASRSVAVIESETDFSDGLGWNAGILHKVSSRFSWGFSFRSGIEVDYNGISGLTQIPTGNMQLDDLIAATLPFDQNLGLTTSIDFPDSAVFGVAFGLTKALLLETDLHLSSWSGLSEIRLESPSQPLINQVIPLDFDDTVTLRVGAQYSTPTGLHLRAGFAVEDSPQPDATVGAFLPDANRTVLSFGIGKDPLDVAFSWVDFDQRIITNQVDGLNGNYRASAWKLSLTLNL